MIREIKDQNKQVEVTSNSYRKNNEMRPTVGGGLIKWKEDVNYFRT